MTQYQLINQRLTQLREIMRVNQVDYLYVPAADQHQNEYVPMPWQRRGFISGFTGSAGDALIGLNDAYLWTDGRYFLQASEQLPAEFTLMKQGVSGVPPLPEFLRQNLHGKTLAVDPKVMTLRQFDQFEAALADCSGKLICTGDNWIDTVWTDQPSIKYAPIRLHELKYAGLSAQEKLTQLRQAWSQIDTKITAQVITRLDDIAWLMNMRGADVDCNPLAIAYAIIMQNQAFLFTALSRVSKDVQESLAKQRIEIKAYDDFAEQLQQLSGMVLLDPAETSFWTQQQLQNPNQAMKTHSPILLAKACKNDAEIAGMIEAHQRDGIAMVRFMHWLESEYVRVGDPSVKLEDDMGVLSEVEIGQKLYDFRSQDETLVGMSFETICGFGAHGAIIHYDANKSERPALIDDSQMLLLDSGGQYQSGTTDITRMFHLGEPTAEQKRHYTLVLKGHLALRHAIFPAGTSGGQIDPLARQYLWAEGLDYRHGTGHGVGAALCVHEGPQRIAGFGGRDVPLQAGMMVSNEPGVYFDGQYGIRIENVCVIKEIIQPSESQAGHGPFYQLQDLTVVPYNRKLMDLSLLTGQEITWINDYHQWVWDCLHAKLSDKEQSWLKVRTARL